MDLRRTSEHMPPAPRPGFNAGWFLIVAAAAMVVIAGLREAQPIIIPTLIAAILAMLAARPVAWLRERKVPTSLAVLLVVVVLFAVLSGVAAVVGQSVNQFTEAVPRYQQRLDALWDSFQDWLRTLPVELPPMEGIELVAPGDVMDLVGTGLRGAMAALSNTLLVVLILVFMLLEAAGFPRKLEVALGAEPDEVGRFTAVTRQVQQYLAIKTVVSLATGVTAGLFVWAVGLDFALLWGLVAFLLNYIPTIGSIIAGIPPVLLALIQIGPGTALLVALGYVVVNTAFGNLIEPSLMGRRLGLSTLVVFLSLVFFGWMWGTIGMLLAVPLTMVVKILLENSEDLVWVARLLDGAKSTEARYQALRERREAAGGSDTGGKDASDGAGR